MAPLNQTAIAEALAKLSRAQEEQAAMIAAHQAEIEKLKETANDTHNKVTDLHHVLMDVAPGHDRSLVQRFAAITIWAESLSRMGYGLKWVAGVLVAVGILIAAVRIGPMPGGDGR
jgi:hypothetical protein